jgi:hypothetical protein
MALSTDVRDASLRPAPVSAKMASGRQLPITRSRIHRVKKVMVALAAAVWVANSDLG